MEEIRFCFKIEAGAMMASDDEGNPAPCYIQLKAEFPNPLDEEGRQKIINAVKEDVSEQFKIDQSMIVPISEAEYDACT